MRVLISADLRDVCTGESSDDNGPFSINKFMIFTMSKWAFIFGVVVAVANAQKVRLKCNETLAPGSTLNLTDKLDLSGRQPDQPKSITSACAIVGPTGDEPAATILVPANDCVLLAQGEVSISGNVRFVVGHKSRKFDCCDDGEGHGGVLCSYTNLTIAENAVVSIETTPGDDTVVINPGIFWTGKFIHVHGVINASLKYGQISGLNGVISSSGIRVSATGKIIGSGMQTIRGAAIQGGDYGTVLDGVVKCTNYTAGDAGGCIASGHFFSFGSSGVIMARNAASAVGASSAGLVVSGNDMSTNPFLGKLTAINLNTSDAGAILACDSIIMSGNAEIRGNNITALGGPAAISSSNFTMKGRASVVVNNSWGGDGGAIESSLVKMFDDSKISCTNAYADSQGGCLAGTLEMDDRAAIIAKNASAKALGGAVAGGYPKQYLIVRGNATIDIDDSYAGLYGGAMFFWQNISFIGEAFEISLKNSAAQCGGGIVSGGVPGEGKIYLDTSEGGTLYIKNSRELNSSKGCITVEANLISGTAAKPGPKIPQPCGQGCSGDLNISNACLCKLSFESSESGEFQECCGKAMVATRI